MAERSAALVWGMRATFVALALLVFFAHLLPLHLVPQRFAPPDILAALTFAWALRRPDYVPALLIAAVLLTADFLFQRPPGLWAALVLICAESLKSQRSRMRDAGFVTEWLTVSGLLLVITIVYRIVLSLLIVAPGTFFLSVMQYSLTVLIYPAVTMLSYLVFGVRRAGPGEIDPMGRRR